MVIEEWEKQSSKDVADWRERWEIAFSRAFERADGAFKGKASLRFTGSTACVVVLSPCQIIASSCGDSRAILCRGKEVISLTVDHKPNRREEVERIERCGGRISGGEVPRVEGILAMTRAIGDHDLKPLIISKPDVTYMQRSVEDECLVLASDGLWDVMSNEQVAKFARKKLQAYRSMLTSDSSVVPAAYVANEFVYEAFGRDNRDNIVVTIVDLKLVWGSQIAAETTY